MSFVIDRTLHGPLEPTSFAAAHGLYYQPDTFPPPIGGAVFGALEGAHVTDRFVFAGERGFEAGNVRGVIGGSTTRQFGGMTVVSTVTTSIPRSYGYLSIALDRMMPHMVLDAKSNNPALGTSLPLSLSSDQRLSLEGDFDKYFTLYCPREYERDALYVFTPDLMAVLIDEAGDVDVEIIDDRLFVYASGGFDLSNPAVWRRLAEIIRIVGAKALTRTGRYADARVGDHAANTVAEPARRLDQTLLGSSDPAKNYRMVKWMLAGLIGFVVLFGAVALFMFLAASAMFSAF
jgi:hypothetical protein